MRENREMDRIKKFEKTIEVGLKGVPELKPEEKRKWLGEFRERIILGLDIKQTRMVEAETHVREALEDPDAEMIILNNKIPMEVTSKYMRLAKEYDKEYKSVATEHEEAMGLVVASRKAVERQEVTPEIKELPSKFKEIRNKDLCPDCYNELVQEAPEYAKEFKKISLVDKMIGIKCGVCQKREDGGPLM